MCRRMQNTIKERGSSCCPLPPVADFFRMVRDGVCFLSISSGCSGGTKSLKITQNWSSFQLRSPLVSQSYSYAVAEMGRSFYFSILSTSPTGSFMPCHCRCFDFEFLRFGFFCKRRAERWVETNQAIDQSTGKRDRSWCRTNGVAIGGRMYACCCFGWMWEWF